jgi:hypothetical protein
LLHHHCIVILSAAKRSRRICGFLSKLAIDSLRTPP